MQVIQYMYVLMLKIAVLGALKVVTGRILKHNKQKQKSKQKHWSIFYIEGSKLFGKPSTNVNKFTLILKVFKEIPFSWDYLFTVSDTGTWAG
jgi:hypothetical protein